MSRQPPICAAAIGRIRLQALLALSLCAPLPRARAAAQPGDEPSAHQPFAFAILADTHVGRGERDFGTPGHDDSAVRLPVAPANMRRIRVAIEKVRALRERFDIRFALVLGDITDTAERSEFQAARELLDGLPVPYFPLLGNHDVWPYSSRGQAPRAVGDAYFQEVFAPTFAELKKRFPDLEKENGPVWNPERGAPSWFQNFAFSYQGHGFLCLDWVSRARAIRPLPGSHPEADLHDFAGGTYQWMSELLRSGWARGKRQVFLFQHHPLRTSRWIPGWAFAFSRGEKRKFQQALGQGPFWGVFAGHQHRAYQGTAFDSLGAWLREAGIGEPEPPPPLPARIQVEGGLRQIETAATTSAAMVTVVQIGADGSVEAHQF